MLQRTIALILSVVFTSILVSGCSSFSTEIEQPEAGEFKYTVPYENRSEVDSYFYSDAYFDRSAKKENEHLISMSMALALAASPAYESETRADNVLNLLGDIGFNRDSIDVQDYDSSLTQDTIGTIIAHKEIDSDTLIAVVVRGQGYDGEWASNVLAGPSGNVQGLDTAARATIERIQKYKVDHGIQSCKYWITGYSRGGAIANLIGVYINENLSSFDTSEKDVYVYTFAAPGGSAIEKVYDNIYNIENRNDLLTYLYPASWGLHNNGNPVVIGAQQTLSLKKYDMNALMKGKQVALSFGSATPEQFFSDLIVWFSGIITRDAYTKTFEDTSLETAIIDILNIYYSKSQDDQNSILTFFKKTLKETIKNSEDVDKLVAAVNGLTKYNSEMYCHYVADTFTAYMDAARTDDLPLTDKEYETIKNTVYPVIRILSPLFVKDFTDYVDAASYKEIALPKLSDYNPTNDPEYNTGTSETSLPSEEPTETTIPDEAEESLVEADEAKAMEQTPGWDDGFWSGYVDACNDAKEGKDAFKQNYNADSYDEDSSNEYKKGYKTGYKRGYEEGFNNYLIEGNSESKPFCHFATLLGNTKYIIKNHNPVENFELIKANDSFYQEPKDQATIPGSQGNPSGTDDGYYISTNITNGTITPSNATVPKGSVNQTFSFTADPGYRVKLVKVDGINKGREVSYTFEKVIKNHSIEVITGPAVEWKNASSWAINLLDEADAAGLIPEKLVTKDFSASINREDFSAIAVELYEAISGKRAIPASYNPFVDTEDEYVLKAYNLGFTKGTSVVKFSPNDYITREQMATMLTRVISKAGFGTSVDMNSIQKFADDSKMQNWGRESIYFMAGKNIIEGVGDNNFNVSGKATLQESIAIVERTVEKFGQKQN